MEILLETSETKLRIAEFPILIDQLDNILKYHPNLQIIHVNHLNHLNHDVQSILEKHPHFKIISQENDNQSDN